MALPSHLSYGIKASVPQRVRSYQSLFQSQNSSYSCASSTTIRLDIPALQNTFLDPAQSYLRFTITNSGANTTQLDYGAWCVIRRLCVYSAGQGTLLEDISSYNLLMNLLVDCTTSPVSLGANLSTCCGTSESATRQGQSIASGASRTFSIPLAGILGQHSMRSLPAIGFTLMLTLEDPLYACVGTTAVTTLNVSDVYYVAQLHQVEAPIYDMLMNSNGGTTLIPGKSFQAFSSTVSSGSSSAVVNLGSRRSSATEILCTLRRNDTYGLFNSPTLTDRQGSLGGTLSGFQLRIGSDLWPAYGPITDSSALYAELMGAFHTWSTNNEALISYSSYNYNTAYSSASRASMGSWAAGLDLEPLGHQASDRLLSGVNLGQMIVCQILLNWSTATTVAGVLDAYVAYDLVLAVTGNQITVSN